MKLTPEQRVELARKKRDGSAYSELMIYGAIKLGTARYRPAHARTARVELNDASSTPAALARILERYASKPSVSGGLLEIICVATVEGFTRLADAGAPAPHVDGATACAAALQQLLARRRSLPMFGEDAIGALVAFWLANNSKPKKLRTILEQLIPARVTDESLAARVVEYRETTAPKSSKRSR